jgi:aspartate aminotransferase
MPERTVIVDGFSKAYAMTGWRLGYGVMPVSVARAVTKLVNNSAACTPGFVQAAGVAALRGPQDSVAVMVRALRHNRDRMVSALNAIPGIACPTPGGAFYAFPDVRGLLERDGGSVETLADRLLLDAGVACLPGTAFGAGGDHHLRFSYSPRAETIETALTRLRAAVGVSAGGVPTGDHSR